jgi:hypothetical protein
MKKAQVIGLVFILCGLISTLSFSILTVRTGIFIIRSHQTSGRVVDMVVRSAAAKNGPTVKTSYPVIRYKDKSGNDQEFEIAPSANNLRIGQKVAVQYIPGKDVNTSRIAGTFTQTWGIILVLGIISIMLNGIGFPILLKSVKK